MTPYETASLAVANGNMVAAIIAAAGIWVFGVGVLVQNWLRAKADQRRAEQADEDRKAAQAQAQAQAAQAQAAQAQAAAAQEQAAEDRKVTQGMLAALQELIRRTSPPPSQDGPRPGPAD